MKNKELQALLAEFPGEADVSIRLHDSRTELEFDKIAISYSGSWDPDPAATAAKVYLGDSPPSAEPLFDGQIRLGLPDEFYALYAEVRMTPAAMLHGFIADLCGFTRADGPRSDGLASNGSDERMLAQQYFERCGYQFMAETPDDPAE